LEIRKRVKKKFAWGGKEAPAVVVERRNVETVKRKNQRKKGKTAYKKRRTGLGSKVKGK